MSTESTLIARVATEGAKKASDELKDFTKTAKEAQSGVGGMLGALSKAPGALKALAIAAGAAMVIKQLSQAALEASQRFDDLNDRAERLGISFQELQVIEVVFGRAGVSVDQASEMMMGFDKAVNMAITSGKGPMAKTLKAMSGQVDLLASEFAGLSGKDGLQLFIQKMQEAGIEERQQKAYLDQLIPGASKLHGVLKDNAQAFDEMGAAMKTAQESFGLDDEDVKNFQDLEKAASDFGVTWDAVSDKFLANISPMTTGIITFVNTAMIEFAKLSDGMFPSQEKAAKEYVTSLETDIGRLKRVIKGIQTRLLMPEIKNDPAKKYGHEKQLTFFQNELIKAQNNYNTSMQDTLLLEQTLLKNRQENTLSKKEDLSADIQRLKNAEKLLKAKEVENNAIVEGVKARGENIEELRKELAIGQLLASGGGLAVSAALLNPVGATIAAVTAAVGGSATTIAAALEEMNAKKKLSEVEAIAILSGDALKQTRKEITKLSAEYERLSEVENATAKEIAESNKAKSEEDLKKKERALKELSESRLSSQTEIFNTILLDMETLYWKQYNDIQNSGLSDAEKEREISNLDFEEEMTDFYDKLLNTTNLSFSEINSIIESKNDERLAEQKRADAEIINLRERALVDISMINADERTKEQIELEAQYQAELTKLKEHLDKKLISITEYNNAVRDANAENRKANADLTNKFQQEDYDNLAKGFDGLSSLFSSYEHESESRRKKAFRAAKAFALASASLHMAGAISKAMDDWEGGSTSGRFALAGGVAAAFGSLIATIQSAEYTPARAQGGQFNAGTYMVGEKGPELVRFGGSGRIASNSDTNKLMSSSTPNITIVNNTSSKIGNVEQQQMDNGDLVLIIQETMERETMQPNSRFNKALTRTRDTKRRI